MQSASGAALIAVLFLTLNLELVCGSLDLELETAPPLGQILEVIGGIGSRSSVAAHRRLTECNATSQPLLWRATKNGNTFYLAASYHTPLGAVNIGSLVKKALSCADVAYFELPCSAAPHGGMGKYLSHCGFYPSSAAQDSIAKRLGPSVVTSLQQAFYNIADLATPECKVKAKQLRPSIALLNQTDFRMALYPYFFQALKVLNPTSCLVSPAGLTHDDELRTLFDVTGRPTFGLEDIDTQCAAIQGNTADQDVQLAQWIIQTFNNPVTAKSIAASKTGVLDALKCGDLQALANSQITFASMPFLTKRVLADRNVGMVANIEKALAKNIQRTVMVVLGALHFATMGTAVGIPTLLLQQGYAVERLQDTTELTCAQSNHTQKGASDLGQCLAPPFKSQPESCLNFTQQFAKKLGEDSLYGRLRDDTACKICSNSTGACYCDVLWANTSGFENLCAQPLAGVTGHVLNMDLTRNPGSSHSHTSMSEKTIRAITQECYATTCDVGFLEEMALRSWYMKYGDLPEGEVHLRPTTPYSPGFAQKQLPTLKPADTQFWQKIPWWGWVSICFAAVLIIGAGVALVLCLNNCMNSKGRHPRSARWTEVDMSDGDTAEESPRRPSYDMAMHEAVQQSARDQRNMEQRRTPPPELPQSTPQKQSMAAASFSIPGLGSEIQQNMQFWQQQHQIGLDGMPIPMSPASVQSSASSFSAQSPFGSRSPLISR